MDPETTERKIHDARQAAIEGDSVADILHKIRDTGLVDGRKAARVPTATIFFFAFDADPSVRFAVGAWHVFEGERGTSDEMIERELRPVVNRWLEHNSAVRER